MFLLGRALTGENVAITAGFNAAKCALDPDISVPLLVAVLGIRLVATAVSVGGGMVGGLFVPLLALGGMVGAIAADVGSVEQTGLSVLVVGAAFLGASYGTPIAALALVAESTGQPVSSFPEWSPSRLRHGHRAAQPGFWATTMSEWYGRQSWNRLKTCGLVAVSSTSNFIGVTTTSFQEAV